jgi:hypothetical protein
MLTKFLMTVVAGASLLLSTSALKAETTVVRIDIGLQNTAVFQVSGSYDGNEILRFKSAIADVPPNVRIIAALNSPGGRMDQGFELGKFFYDARIPTIVLAGHSCASSCTNAFFGGRDPVTGQPLRIMASGSKLGFHNFKMGGLPDQAYTKVDAIEISRRAQKLMYDHLIYLKSVEAPIRAIVLSLGTPSEDLNWLSEADALALDITILNLETGRLVSPGNLASRTR